MKQIFEYLDLEIARLEHTGYKDSCPNETIIYDKSRLAVLGEIRKKINGSAPELHVCPDCMADLAYCKQSPGDFELVFVRHHS